METIAPGVVRIRFGEPEKFTPVALREQPPRVEGFASLPAPGALPFNPGDIAFRASARGSVVEIPMRSDEQIYGFGLQLKSLNQTGRKRTIRVNSDPAADLGDSHAPVPFYVSNAGYGVLIDTLRYARFNTGSHVKVGVGAPATAGSPPSGSLKAMYDARRSQGTRVVAEVPVARGVDVYLFAGPTLTHAVQRYNLFSGGGVLPPMWGLGNWYRGFHHHDAHTLMAQAQSFRDANLPFDVFGLEPGWQTHAYSCTYVWNRAAYPDPDAFAAKLKRMGFHLNLWEHVFVHPDSPIHAALKPCSGDYEVWGGLVPDLNVPAARETFARHHDETFVSRGIDGFKLDECDHSDFLTYAWSFPEASEFPSGLDGEQMHSALGVLYQRTILDLYRRHNRRTLSQVRASHALASPLPFVLYSDLYDHRDFVRGVATMGFSGLLWSPEVREGHTVEGLIRRLQSVVLSPQSLVNAWYIRNPPWFQVDFTKNNAGEPIENRREVEGMVREILEFRMRILPYLYAAFARYLREGLPPFRALAMDWPGDPRTFAIDDQYMLGQALLVAPMFTGQTQRDVYLPAGDWYDFHTHRRFDGGKTHTVYGGLRHIPMFVRGGTILALAEPVQHVRPDTVFEITAQTFGQSVEPLVLWEDDGETFDHQTGAFNLLRLDWSRTQGPMISRQGAFNRRRYQVIAWEHYE